MSCNGGRSNYGVTLGLCRSCGERLVQPNYCLSCGVPQKGIRKYTPNYTLKSKRKRQVKLLHMEPRTKKIKRIRPNSSPVNRRWKNNG